MPGKPIQFEIIGKDVRDKPSGRGDRITWKATCAIKIRADGQVYEKVYSGAADPDRGTAQSNALNRAVKGAEGYRDTGRWA